MAPRSPGPSWLIAAAAILRARLSGWPCGINQIQQDDDEPALFLNLVRHDVGRRLLEIRRRGADDRLG